MICDRCGVDLPESLFWDDECLMCHSEDKIKELEAEIKDHKKTINNQTESYEKALNYNNDLEQENQRLKEEKEKIIHFALLLYRSEYAGDEKYLMDDFHRSLQKALEG